MKLHYSWGDHTLINLTLFLTEKHAGHENKLHDPPKSGFMWVGWSLNKDQTI